MKKIIVLFLVMTTCMINAQEKPLDHVDIFTIEDMDFSVFENPTYKNKYEQSFNKENFLTNYFKVWNDDNNSIPDIMYKELFSVESMIKRSPCIAENYNELSQEIIQEIKTNTNIAKEDIGKETKLGIVVKLSNLRVFPTEEICFKNVRNAGESFPFDYFQNSSIYTGAPVKILATSKDEQWYLADTHNNLGWIKAENIAIISKEKASALQKLEFSTPIKDKTFLKGKHQTHKIYIGTILPTINNTLLIPRKNIDNTVFFDTIATPKDSYKSFPIAFHKDHVKSILSELVNHKYSWGGINGGRDCSSTIKDFLTPFGMWLPRNSGQQKKHGEQIELTGSNDEKLKIITDKGIPFLSTIYKKGHIVLYAGKTKTGIPIVFQNVWGVKAYYKNKHLSKFATNREKYGIFGIHNKKEKNTVEVRFNISRAVITNVELSPKLNKFKNLSTESFLKKYSVLTNLNANE